MKKTDLKKFRGVMVKPFKHTDEKSASMMSHLVHQEGFIVDFGLDNKYVFFKEDLRDQYFYLIHRKDLKKHNNN